MRGFVKLFAVTAVAAVVAAGCTDTSRIDQGLAKVHAAGWTGKGTTVAVIDRGIAEPSSVFGDRVVAEGCFTGDGTGTGTGFDTPLCPNGKNTMTGTGAALACASVAACSEHGHEMTALAAGNIGQQNLDGVAPEANIIAVRTGSSTFCWLPLGQCDNHDTTWALNQSFDYVYSLRNHYKIAAVNVSLGDDELGDAAAACPDSPLAASIGKLRAAGIAVVVASGDAGNVGTTANPACVPDATTVGGTQQEGGLTNGHVSSVFDTAAWVDLLATGDFVTLVHRDGSSDNLGQGTSISAAYVTGAMALLRQQHPDWTVDQMEAQLKSTGTDTTDPRNGITFKRINIARSLGVS